MMSRSLWRGFDPPTTRPLPRNRNRLKESTVHYLFSVRNMFFYCLQEKFIRMQSQIAFSSPLRSPIPSLQAALPCDLCFGASVSIQINARFKCCSPTTNALADLSHDRKTRSVSRRNLAGAPVARSREHEVIPGA